MDLDERPVIVESEETPDESYTAFRHGLYGHKGAAVDRKEVHRDKEPANKRNDIERKRGQTRFRRTSSNARVCNCKRRNCAMNIGEKVRSEINSTF